MKRSDRTNLDFDLPFTERRLWSLANVQILRRALAVFHEYGTHCLRLGLGDGAEENYIGGCRRRSDENAYCALLRLFSAGCLPRTSSGSARTLRLSEGIT